MGWSGRDDDHDGIDDGLAADLERSYGRNWREEHPEVVERAREATSEGYARGSDIPESEYTRYMDAHSPGWRDNPEEVARVRAAESGAGLAGSSAISDPDERAFLGEDERELDDIWSDLERSLPQRGEMRASAEGYEAASEGDTALAGAKADPLAIEAQRRALAGLADASKARGLQAMDTAQLARIREEEGMDLRARQQAIQQMAAQRGMRGGGAEVADVMGAQQQMARGLGDRGVGVDQAAMQRALAAIGARSGLASGMRGQSFAEGARAATAQDEISMRNQARMNAARQFGAGARNAAGAQNTGVAERMFGMRAGIAAGRTGRLEEEEARREQARQRAEQRERAAIGAATTAGTAAIGAAIADDDEDDED